MSKKEPRHYDDLWYSSDKLQALKCPYCLISNKDDSRKTGNYRVSTFQGMVLHFVCASCGGVFRTMKFGPLLLWSHMTPQERRAHRPSSWSLKMMKENTGLSKVIDKKKTNYGSDE